MSEQTPPLQAAQSAVPIVTRFAPSPTGYLQVGNARSALFPWLLARHSGGRFFLRIEDTDLARSSEAYVRAIEEDLRWLGLNWDNPELIYQSKRLHIYEQVIADLMARGLAYKAFETEQELAAQRLAAEKAKRPNLYRRPSLTDAQMRAFEAEGRPYVVRFAMPAKEYRFTDVVLGKEILVGPDQVQDFVIRKGDGMPTYHFAVVVDDAEMNITHVLRGQEHLLNTVNHLALQEALGYSRPVYGHLPVILNDDGSKMSKRDRDKKVRHQTGNWLKNTKRTPTDLATTAGLEAAVIESWLKDDKSQLGPDEHQALMPVIGLKPSDLPEILIRDFRASGYLPEVLLNAIALLGWNPGGDRERMTRDELVELFSLDRVGSSNAKFNREKLLAFNTEACAATSPSALVPAMRQFLATRPESPLHKATDPQLARLMEMKKGFRVLREVEEVSRLFFVPDHAIAYDAAAVEKVLRKQEGYSALANVRPVLAGVPDWTAPSLEAAVNQHCQAAGLALGKVAQPIRLAISGSTVSPPIFETLEFLGRERTLARIDRCIAAAAEG